MAKKLEEFCSDRRAVTPVLSNLLLTVVAVAAMALATTATYAISANLRETMSERIIIEDLWFGNSSTSIDVYIRNVGKVTVHISAVYINHTSKSFTGPFDLEVDGHRWLSVSQEWVSGDLYSVDVVTTRGTHVGGYYKTP
jgi:hypothetical protein